MSFARRQTRIESLKAFASCFLALAFVPCLWSQEITPSLTSRMEKLVPHASGLALVEVTNIKEVDRRAGDGPLSQDISFKIVKSTGTTLESVSIIKESGGHMAPPTAAPRPKPRSAVSLKTFTKGERYWVVFASYSHVLVEYHDGILAVWPIKDAPKELEAAVQADLYSHRPQYDPKSGLTFSWRNEKEKKSWQIRMEKDGKQLWEKSLPGEKFGGTDRFSGQWTLLHRDQWPSGLGFAEQTPSNWYLLAESLTDLDAGNPYQLPAGKYRIVSILVAETGKTAGVRVCPSNSADPRVIHFYKLQTGKLMHEEWFDFLTTGGKAAGNSEESWLRKTVRKYEPATGQLKQEEIYRFASTPQGSTFLPVKK
ncbi:MAG: hypothetical protein U0798_13810 [Gemmataceae bacterium]